MTTISGGTVHPRIHPAALARPALRKARDLARRTLPTRHPAILVASIGRSGSALLYDAIREGLARDRFAPLARRRAARSIVRGAAFFLEEAHLDRGTVYKTHGLPGSIPEPRAGAVGCVFIYGSAVRSALSVYSSADHFGEESPRRDLKHFRAEGSHRDIVDADILGFRRQIEQWTRAPNIPTRTIRYDALWRETYRIETLLDFGTDLPPQRERQSLPCSEDETRLARTITPTSKPTSPHHPIASSLGEGE